MFSELDQLYPEPRECPGVIVKPTKNGWAEWNNYQWQSLDRMSRQSDAVENMIWLSIWKMV